jgi:hypothetical protein
MSAYNYISEGVLLPLADLWASSNQSLSGSEEVKKFVDLMRKKRPLETRAIEARVLYETMEHLDPKY